MRRKIVLDFNQSNYKVAYEGLMYVFSSETNQNKFSKQIKEYINKETLDIKYRYSNLNINFDLFLTFALYKRIEKRGFKIYTIEDHIELKEDTLFLICYKSPNSNHY